MFRMRLVDLPDWARRGRFKVDGVNDWDMNAIRYRRPEMLRAVHEEIEAYLNDPLLYFDGDEDGFPHRKELTGEYYIGDESYFAHTQPSWIQIKIEGRCIGRGVGNKPDDYLGLEVWLRCEPGTWSFSVYRNTDSSAI
jgi:hypothetical protein